MQTADQSVARPLQSRGMTARLMTDATSSPREAWLIRAGVAFATVALGVGVLATRTGDEPARHLDAAVALAEALPWTALWLVSALGWGVLVHRLARLGDELRRPVVAGGGVAMMLAVDAAAGSAGALASPVGAWIVLLPGLALAGWELRSVRGWPARPSWIWLTLLPPVAVLLIASVSTPGWLWATEFKGYDALSYHLQAPREWLDLGRITPLTHNVYAAFPNHVEGSTLHLMALTGDLDIAARAAQLLQATMTVLAAIVVGHAATVASIQRGGGAVRQTFSGVLGAAIMLVTPWAVVVGSLAYVEATVNLMLASGLALVLMTPRDQRLGRGAAVLGLLIGAACGAKLTAVGMVLLPLVIALAVRIGVRGALAVAPLAAGTTLLVLSPWLIRNGLALGNPVFPFLTGIFGAGEWSATQVDDWARSHGPIGGVAERATALWRQWLAFGLGGNPAPGEPWRPQWAATPWFALIALGLTLARSRTRSVAAVLGVVLVVQLAFWLGLTHLQSRFLLPTLVPMALVIGLLPGVVAPGPAIARGTARLLTIAFALAACAPVILYLTEQNQRPAAFVRRATLLTAEGLSDDDARLVAAQFPSAAISRLPRGSKTLLVGEAAPFHYRGDIAYSTVWDRGPLSRIIADGAGPEAWAGRLAGEGFTHVLIAPEMLINWRSRGQGDPALDPEVLFEVFETHARRLATYASGARLYRLRSR